MYTYLETGAMEILQDPIYFPGSDATKNLSSKCGANLEKHPIP